MTSPRENHGDVSWVVSTHLGPQSRCRFAAQAKPVRFGSAGASALHTLPFGFNPVDARDKILIARGVLITPPFVGPFVGQ